MSSLSIGQILLNQFRVEAFVASGGMGAVYRVWDLKRNVPLAMKVLHSDLADDPTIFKRFKREANALKKLAHPNIVTFYGLYHTSEFAFLLERYVDGPSLKEILQKKRRKPMQVYEVLTFLKALSAALGYAHANGVVHCDVKPGNVMIDQGGNIFLTDFGIARHAESTTTTLATVGTAAYMAPEQIRGEAVTPATDIYALGVMLYEMLTGQRPFKGDEKGTESEGATAGERIRYGHLMLSPPDPRLSNPSLSTQLAQTILRSLEKQPSQRFQNVQDFYISACNAAGLDASQLVDRITPPAGIKDTELGEDRGLAGNLRERATTIKGGNRRRLMPWMIFGISIVLVGVLILGLGKGTVPPIFPATASQNTKVTLASSPFAVIPLTLTLPSTFTPLPRNTYTPTALPTVTSSPTPSGDQPWGKIVFSCRTNGEIAPYQICMMNADGSNWRKMTYEDSYGHYYSSLSPDGQSIVFAANMTGKSEIYEMDLQGHQRRLTNDLGPLSGPEISPDGHFIVFTKEYEDTHQGIWVMDRDGKNPHLVYQNPPGDALDPTWSPDGTQILFASGGGENKHLFIINPDGTGLQPIINDFSTRGRSDWSSYGSLIVGYSGNPWYRELFIMNPDGTNLHQITSGWQNLNPPYGNSQGPSFSPDGQWITFTAYPQINVDSGCEIYIIRIDGTDIRRLTNNNYCDYQPRWGP